MTTRFATHFSQAAAPNIVRQFGDSVTYLPRHGDPRTGIMAVIERDAVETEDGVIVKQMILKVENSANSGISSTEIDEGGDQVVVPIRVGEDAVTKTIQQVISTENGLVRFLVQ